jgi:hypothetical protein
MGTHPAYLLASALYRLFERPWVLGGLCIVVGYVQAALRRQPRYDDPEFRDFLRRWQTNELKRMLTLGLWRRPASPLQHDR